MSSDTENNAIERSSKEDEVIEDFMNFLMIVFMNEHMNASTTYNRSKLVHLKECVGAIDGTLVDAWVSASRQNIFRGRKATVSQNVLAVCDFDMLFTFINSGWEGSTHDNTILVDSITRADLHFPHPPHERTFGALKKRFQILQSMPNYMSTRQGPLVITCCVVHNWIRLHAAMNPFFIEADNEMAAETAADGFVGGQVDYVDMSQHGLTYQSNFKDAIAIAMWQNHVGHG
ncbi:uncharacterized protein LOC114260650 [Camellia sinensis]|uniref:uncharacterized protein LOC114260650 n=1 Tax=Camellia sinensis TaxID=4442 RepID=UPI0010369620|nr:uncharacterized protein LOC114260650 [Camellia sinensis]